MLLVLIRFGLVAGAKNFKEKNIKTAGKKQEEEQQVVLVLSYGYWSSIQRAKLAVCTKYTRAFTEEKALLNVRSQKEPGTFELSLTLKQILFAVE